MNLIGIQKNQKETKNLEVKDKTFFVTSEKISKNEYEILSRELELPYGGLLS